MGCIRSGIRSTSLALLLLAGAAQAANVCDPTTGTDCVNVQIPASGANTTKALVTRTIGKSTYSASTATAASGVVVAAASAAPFFCIYGSATKTVIVHRAVVSGPTLTAVAYHAVVAAKYSTAPTGGTPTVLTQVPHDSNSAAGTASLAQVYTAAPTAGTLVGPIMTRRFLSQATTAAAAGIPDVNIEFNFNEGNNDTTGVYLRGTTQGLCLNFGAAPASAVTLSVAMTWTEQASTVEP